MKYLSMLKNGETLHPDPLQKPQKDLFAVNAVPQGKGFSENREPETPDLRSLRVYSQALEREVTVLWEGDNPAQVFVEGQAYSLPELAEMEGFDAQAVKTAHKLKTVFRGSRVGKSEDPPGESGPVDFDQEIEEVIHEFGMAGVSVTNAPPEIKQEAFEAEDRITEAANQGDVMGFRRALHSWRLAWIRTLH